MNDSLSASPTHEYVSFTDETCTTAHDYMVIGGVLCREDCSRAIIADLAHLHSTRPIHWSYEWKNVRPRNLQRYDAFVDLFFKYNKEHCVDFSCIVIDCRQLNHSVFNNGDGEKGFNKFMYQQLLRHFRHMGPRATFRCYHDRRSSQYDLEDVRDMLDAKCFKKDPALVRRYRELAYADKRDRPMLQFADVLIGAVGFAWNGKPSRFAKSHKAQLTERVRQLACVPTLAAPTRQSERHFNIWPFTLKSTP